MQSHLLETMAQACDGFVGRLSDEELEALEAAAVEIGGGLRRSSSSPALSGASAGEPPSPPQEDSAEQAEWWPDTDSEDELCVPRSNSGSESGYLVPPLPAFQEPAVAPPTHMPSYGASMVAAHAPAGAAAAPPFGASVLATHPGLARQVHLYSNAAFGVQSVAASVYACPPPPPAHPALPPPPVQPAPPVHPAPNAVQAAPPPSAAAAAPPPAPTLLTSRSRRQSQQQQRRAAPWACSEEEASKRRAAWAAAEASLTAEASVDDDDAECKCKLDDPSPAPLVVAAPPRQPAPAVPAALVVSAAPGAALAPRAAEAASSEALAWPAEGSMQAPTTFMLRNLPRTLRQRQLMDELDASGFAGSYDFCYVPCTFDTQSNKGYGFVNLIDPEVASEFFQKWHCSWRLGSTINLRAAAVQGLLANMEKWEKPRMRRVRNSDLRPWVAAGCCAPAVAAVGTPAAQQCWLAAAALL